jgi:predicted RNase H-like HicB family nuclease
MTRKYSLLIEGDESGYSAHVPELPSILVTGQTVEELRTRATEAIQLWWEHSATDPSPSAQFTEIEVELPSR